MNINYLKTCLFPVHLEQFLTFDQIDHHAQMQANKYLSCEEMVAERNCINQHSKLDWTKGNIFSNEDKTFMDIVHSDIKNYLKKNIFPSRTVLVFPPFNGFRRFLIHKLIEDSFAPSQVAAFSIGQDVDRRIVICYKGLLREDQPKSVQQSSRFSMIEKESLPRQRSTPTAAVYRPPAARLAETRRNIDEVKTGETKRVRRPAQQLYVPRPKRVSYSSELPRSRSHSSSRTSLDSDSCNDKPDNKTEDRGSSEAKAEINAEYESKSLSLLQQKKCCKEEASSLKEPENSSVLESTVSSVLKTVMDTKVKNACHEVEDKRVVTSYSVDSTESSIISVGSEVQFMATNVASETSAIGKSQNIAIGCEDCLKYQSNGEMHDGCQKVDPLALKDKYEFTQHNISENSLLINRSMDETKTSSVPAESKEEAMDTITISSDSRDDLSNSLTTSSSDSREIESSSETEAVRKSEKMEIEHSSKPSPKKSDCDSEKCEPREKNKKNRRIFPNAPVSDVLIISDSSSSSDSFKMASDIEPKKGIRKENLKKQARLKDTKMEKPAKKEKVDLGESDWEALYDDSGECLVPDLMEELTNSVGRVRVASADSDYRQFQTIEERTNDGECIIEIYDFPAEFKTTDLINIFATYRNRNFQIKWVDDTHALGVFPSPLMADEVLSCTLPFVKTRPLRLGIAESRIKARNLVLPALPPMERPKTCTALARRLVSGALGLRLPTSSQDREKERQMLKEAREKRRLEAKQREAAWDGTISSESCI